MRSLVLTLCGALLLSTVCLSQNLPQSAPAPVGKLVDVGHRKLHLYCSGTGKPEVILMAGGGAYAIDWALVQPKLSETTRVCSFDRAGLGWSDPGPADETVEQTVADLHALLRNAGEKPPYVLVGASIAGIYIQAYQRSFPAEVAALVFSNSSNRVGMMVKGKGSLLWELTEDELRSAFPLPASVKGPAPSKEDEPFDRLPAELQSARLWFEVKEWERFDPTKARGASMLSWRKEFLKEFEESAAKERPLGTLPVLVISSNPAADASERLARATAGVRLDFLSSNTLHITAEGSGHEIHLFQPDTVVQGIRQLVSAIRKGSPLAASRQQ